MRPSLFLYFSSCLLLLACGTDETGLSEISPPNTGGTSTGGNHIGGAGNHPGGFAGSLGGNTTGGKTQGGNEQGGAGNEPGGNEPGGNEPGGNEPGGNGPGGNEPGGNEPGGNEPGGNEPGGNGPGGNEPGGGGAGGSTTAGAGSSTAGQGGSTTAGVGGNEQGGAGQGGAGQGGAGQSQGGNEPGGGGQSQGGTGGTTTCSTGVTNSCGACLDQSCCEQANDCDANCQACLLGDSAGKNCKTNPQVKSLEKCIQLNCKNECFSATNQPVCEVPKPAASQGSCVTIDDNLFKCNPITNSGCDSGERCAFWENKFDCYSNGTIDLCQSCGGNNGSCKAGSICNKGQCEAYCCDDADCGAGEICDKKAFDGADAIGLCRHRRYDGVDLCQDDPHEPNNLESTAFKLNPTDDCSGQKNLSVSGSINPSSDKDWYEIKLSDAGQCYFTPFFQLQSVPGLKVCAYFKCDMPSGGQPVACPKGSTSSQSTLGNGCCSTNGNLQPQFNCGGPNTQKSGTVHISVEANTSNSTCTPYQLNYGF